jgi:branched-chain amino acid transport system permease protein
LRNKSWLWIIVVIGIAAILPAFLGFYQVHILDLIMLFIILAIGLDLTLGYCGQVNLGHAAFYAVGAYTSAILTTKYNFSFWAALPISVLLSVLCGVLIGLPSLKVRSHYLAIATLGLSVALNDILINDTNLTGGPTGISGIPKPELFGISLNTEYRYYYLVFVFAILLFLLARIIVKYGLGRSFRAVREDHIAAQALGINIAAKQIIAFGFSGFYAGIAGALYSSMISYVSPDSFQFNEMLFILTTVVIRGMGNIYGAISGATLLIVLREMLNQFQNWQQVIYGVVIVVLVVFLPGGLVSITKLGRKNRQKNLNEEHSSDAKHVRKALVEDGNP